MFIKLRGAKSKSSFERGDRSRKLHIGSPIDSKAHSPLASWASVIGEQVSKIFAIRRPEQIALWCAVPMRFFYVASYPLLVILRKQDYTWRSS